MPRYHTAPDIHVHHNEVSHVKHISHNATHKGSGKYYSIRPRLIKEILNGILVYQVQFLVTMANKVGIRLFQIAESTRP